MLIVIDGVEGAGKSTQVARLADRLRAEGQLVTTIRDPGGTPLGEAIRTIVKGTGVHYKICDKAELLLFAASRAQMMEEAVNPALLKGIVICDRFWYSTIAYQGHGRGLSITSPEMVVAINYPTPDITFILDVTLATSRHRVKSRGVAKDRIEGEHDSFFEKVSAGFKALWFMPGAVVINANNDEAQVSQDIWEWYCKLKEK